MKNKIMLDSIDSREVKERISKVLDEIPLSVVSLGEGTKVFPHLEVRRRGKGLYVTYDLIPSFLGNFRIEIPSSLPRGVSVMDNPLRSPDFFVYDRYEDIRRVTYKFKLVQRDLQLH